MVRTENLNVGRHVVQFYGRDEELADRVTDYLLGALDGGGVAVVIATPEHRREFESRLGQVGVDLAGARDDGSYLALDASQTLRQLMAADKLDPAAFDRVIGDVIRRAGAGGRPTGRSSAPDPAPSGPSRSRARRPRRHVISPWPRWRPGAPRISPTTPP